MSDAHGHAINGTSDNVYRLAFWIVLVLGAGVRLFQFGAVPAGLNVDEASVGVEAYAISHYGVDRWGSRYPVFFPAYGDGLNPLDVYLSVPFVKLLGLNVAAVRCVNLIAGIFTIPLVYLVARLGFGSMTAILSMAFFALLPWHIMLSRWGADVNLLPVCILSGLGLLMIAVRDDASPLIQSNRPHSMGAVRLRLHGLLDDCSAISCNVRYLLSSKSSGSLALLGNLIGHRNGHRLADDALRTQKLSCQISAPVRALASFFDSVVSRLAYIPNRASKSLVHPEECHIRCNNVS